VSLELILYARANDPAGDSARRWSDALQSEYPHRLEVRDVDSRPEWKQAFGAVAPVAEVNGRRLAVPLTQTELRSALALAGAIGQYRQATHVPPPVAALSSGADRLSVWFWKHWLAMFNGFLAAYLGLSFLAPVLMKIGAPGPANVIYTVYSFTCHQLGFRSFFLFGEQPNYPRAEFAAATGVNPDDLWAARAFTGNPVLGYKVALCERDVAIYAAMLLFGIAFAFLRRRYKVKPLHWALWILIGVVPIGLDGGTQLLSYIPFLHFPFRESTALLRVLTGSLFGITSAWFAYPYVEESMDEDLGAQPVRRS
jgi:uncharacterized membrane protein